MNVSEADRCSVMHPDAGHRQVKNIGPRGTDVDRGRTPIGALGGLRDIHDRADAQMAVSGDTQEYGPRPRPLFKLISAWPAGNVGDENQSKGIASALNRALVRANAAKQNEISSETLEIASLPGATKAERLSAACETWLSALRDGDYEKVFFILSGSGEQLASTLGGTSNESGLITVFSGHQLSDDIKAATRLPSITALPATSVTANESANLARKTKLVLVSGVAHQLTDDKVAQTVAEYRAQGYKLLPRIDADTVAVILGGDAPDEEGHFRLFSEGDARRLAQCIAQVELSGRKGCRFIVTNGPRTGKFGRDGAECSPNPHRTGEVDHVTRA